MISPWKYHQSMNKMKSVLSKDNYPHLIYLSPRFLGRLNGFNGFSVAVGRRSAIHTEFADLLLQLLVSTFPHFVAIGFYFLSETLNGLI